jgi:hypothetical protein
VGGQHRDVQVGHQRPDLLHIGRVVAAARVVGRVLLVLGHPVVSLGSVRPVGRVASTLATWCRRTRAAAAASDLDWGPDEEIPWPTEDP